MRKSVTVNISSPCAERWETFTPTERGAFCSSCSKEVIDFTSLSDLQIIEFFKAKPKNSCGRFRNNQLTTYHFQNDSINPGWKLWKAGLVAIALTILSKPSVGQVLQEKQKTEQHENDTATQQFSEKSKLMSVGGIINYTDSSPLPGVNVVVAGTTRGVLSDTDGKFQVTDVKEGDSLVFSFIGLKSQTKSVTGQDMKITMENDDLQLGSVVVVAGNFTVTNRVSFRRWWWKLKNVF